MVSGALASARHLCRLAGRTCQLYGRNNLEKTEVRDRERRRRMTHVHIVVIQLYKIKIV